jgi:acetyl-CoA carboxylase carboxyltransferase component
MVKKTSSMSLGGARLVKAATGEDVTDHDMGGSQVHCYESGVGDLEVEDDAACIASVKEFLSFLPSHNQEPPPIKATEDPPTASSRVSRRSCPRTCARPTTCAS